MDLRLDVSEQDDWSVLQVGGEIDVATAPRLREQLDPAGQRPEVPDRGRPRGCRLHRLHRARRPDRRAQAGAHPRRRPGLVCTEPRILKVFEITGLEPGLPDPSVPRRGGRRMSPGAPPGLQVAGGPEPSSRRSGRAGAPRPTRGRRPSPGWWSAPSSPSSRSSTRSGAQTCASRCPRRAPTPSRPSWPTTQGPTLRRPSWCVARSATAASASRSRTMAAASTRVACRRTPRSPTRPGLEYEGGLGIPLIRLLADELEFQPSPGGTTVVMTFGPRSTVDRSTV